MREDRKSRVHVFDTHFYTALRTCDPSHVCSLCSAKIRLISFQPSDVSAMRKWQASQRPLQKDFVMIPIHHDGYADISQRLM